MAAGSIEAVKKTAELSKKLEEAKREVKRKSGYLESDLRFNRDTTNSRIDLKYAADRVKSIQKELDKYT